MEIFPKEVLVSHYQPETRLVQIVAKMKDVPGALAAINAVTAGLNVDLRQSIAHSAPDGSYAIFNSFAELKDPKLSTSDIISRLKDSSFVLDADVVDAREGRWLIDTLTFPVNWMGRRIVVFDQLSLGGMLERIRTLFSSGADVIIYEEGLSYGKGLAERLSLTLGREFVLKNYDYALKLISATGWGKARVESASDDLKTIVIRVERSFECEERKSEHPSSSFVRGFVSGIFESLTKKTIECKETECIARGDSSCKFVLHAKTDSASV